MPLSRRRRGAEINARNILPPQNQREARDRHGNFFGGSIDQRADRGTRRADEVVSSRAGPRASESG